MSVRIVRLLVLGGYSQKILGRCLFHKLEQQADPPPSASSHPAESSPRLWRLNACNSWTQHAMILSFPFLLSLLRPKPLSAKKRRKLDVYIRFLGLVAQWET